MAERGESARPHGRAARDRRRDRKIIGGNAGNDALKGRRMLVTSGPTREPIDPVRYLSNRSSGKQGTRWRARRRRPAPKSCLFRVP